MSSSLAQVRGASIPAASLAVLGDLRRDSLMFVVVREERAWLWWELEDSRAAERLLSLSGVELFERRDNLWYRFGSLIPCVDIHFDYELGVPLYRAITPMPIQPTMPAGLAPLPTPLRLVRDEQPRAATAMQCSLTMLTFWTEVATSHRIGSLTAAISDKTVLLRGERLPTFRDGGRFWGNRLLIPLEFRHEPALHEAAVLAALGASSNELVLLSHKGYEIISLDAFRPISRAAIRAAMAGAL